MLRFVIRRQINDRLSGLVTEGLETIDADCPELEAVLAASWSRQEEYDHRTVAGVEVLPKREREPTHTDLLLLAAADLQSWMKSYGPDGATSDLVQRLRDAALGVVGTSGGEQG
jgi:hypothetical protein